MWLYTMLTFKKYVYTFFLLDYNPKNHIHVTLNLGVCVNFLSWVQSWILRLQAFSDYATHIGAMALILIWANSSKRYLATDVLGLFFDWKNDAPISVLINIPLSYYVLCLCVFSSLSLILYYLVFFDLFLKRIGKNL